ncbi:MAG: hypothetical protein AB2L21_00660 [Anaerolineaceae bacterium]
MSKKTLSMILIVAGVILFIFSLIADLINPNYYPGFNWAQITGTAVGFTALLIGLWLRRAK